MSRFPVGAAVGFYAVLAAVAAVWRLWTDGEPPWLASGAALPGPGGWASGAALGVGSGLALVALSRQWTARSAAGRRLARTLAEALGPLSLPAVLALALASGIGEELFFRGALQPRVGLLPASLLFGLAHFMPGRGLALWAAFAAASGLLFGVLFQETGNVLAPALAHVVVNGINLRWLARAGLREDEA